MQRGREVVLWIWTIPLGVSDLAAGLVWLAILQNTGYLNTVLFHLGVIDGPTAWLNSETPVTLFIAVVVAEIWRSTAVVLVIIVAIALGAFLGRQRQVGAMVGGVAAAPAVEATIFPGERGEARVKLREPQRAVTPGQAAVCYRGDEVLGGGWIESTDPAWAQG